MGVVNRTLSRLFYGLGERVGRRPKSFIVGSILVSLALGTGLVRLRYENNVEKLFTNTEGPFQMEKAVLEQYFPYNGDGTYNPSRSVRIGRFARMIILAKDGGTVFRTQVWDEVLAMDALVQSTTVEWKGEGGRNYSSLCGRWGADCYENTFLDLAQVMGRIEKGSLKVNYPFMLNPETYNAHVIALHFGGVQLTNDSYYVAEAKAVNLNYFLSVETEEDDDRGYAWESQLLNAIEAKIPELDHIRVYRQTFKSFSREADLNILSVIPLFWITLGAMSLFVILSALSRDWVQGKPWIGLLGMLCVGMGVLAACGILSFIGVPFIGLNGSVPFIMLGIGMDDTFVILAAWRQTNPLDPVPTRLANCYSEAAVSITITTLTDMFSFYVGLMTPIPSVQIFSAYAGTCVLWIYFMQVFLLSGFLAISGEQEERNRHAVFWWIQATPKSQAEGRSRLYQRFFTGGINREDPNNPKDRPENGVMAFFRDSFAPFLGRGWVKLGVILLFLAYFGVAGYGITTMEEGLQLKRIYRDDSYMYEFLEIQQLYFTGYPHRVQVLITSPLDYSNSTVQAQVYALLDQMTSLDTMTYEYAENWLLSYTRFIEGYKELYDDLDISSEAGFISALRSEYLNGSSSVFAEDVRFNPDFTSITASRFVLQSRNVHTTLDETRLVEDLRRLARNSPTFNVSIFHPTFSFSDQYLIIREQTVRLLASAGLVTVLVALLFIPNLVVILCVFLSVISIEVGVVGFMCLWGISLDLLSILCLIMCVGFSVDFSAHVSYAYISAEGSSEERVRKALHGLGLPILQGGASTVIGVLTLLIQQSYSFSCFFKIIFLVIVFAAWHGLLVLPVLLLLIRPERIYERCWKKTAEEEQEEEKGKEGPEGKINRGFDNTRL